MRLEAGRYEAGCEAEGLVTSQEAFVTRKNDLTPTLQQNIAFAISAWFGGKEIIVPETLDALVGTIASIAVKGGCSTPERRLALADHLRTNVLSALEYYGENPPT
jgi:hypothetical protein